MAVLDGIKVLDFSGYLAGPYCTMVLADLGADVLKVERFPGGDDSRSMGPHKAGESHCFATANRNKRSIALDLKHPKSGPILERLVSSADVLVESFRPGVLERLGLGYPACEALNPELVYCSISGFGQTGPYRQRPGYDIIAQGMGGLMRMTGEPNGGPAKAGVAFHDVMAGATAVQGVLAALIGKNATGRGQYVDVSLLESGLSAMVWETAAFFGSGEEPVATGTRHRRSAPYQAFQTEDGYVTVGAANDRLWEIFCRQVVERPRWLEDPRFGDVVSRAEHVNELEQLIEHVMQQRSTDHWVKRLEEAGVPGGPVWWFSEAITGSHLVERGMVVEVDHPVIGRHPVLGSPIKLSHDPTEIRRPAPLLGEHTTEVLTDLGVSDTEVAALLQVEAFYSPLPVHTGDR